MFTGLIEEVGVIQKIKTGKNSAQFFIKAAKVMDDTKIGDSICTNGVCLTIVEKSPLVFAVDIMSETIKMTNFSDLKIGSKVNLERAMRLSDRLGGHLVSGHIDGTGKIVAIKKDDIAWRIHIESISAVIHKILDKGSIAIDGISLTVVQVFDSSFEVSIIPHTAKETNLLDKKTGDTVNLETDMIGKYVLHFLSPKETQAVKNKIDLNFLQENGFI
jgi:riboflavin synthase